MEMFVAGGQRIEILQPFILQLRQQRCGAGQQHVHINRLRPQKEGSKTIPAAGRLIAG